MLYKLVINEINETKDKETKTRGLPLFVIVVETETIIF